METLMIIFGLILFPVLIIRLRIKNIKEENKKYKEKLERQYKKIS